MSPTQRTGVRMIAAPPPEARWSVIFLSAEMRTALTIRLVPSDSAIGPSA